MPIRWRPTRASAALLTAAVTLCGCSISIGHDPDPSRHKHGIAHSQLVDNTLTIDLVSAHPTRADFGMDDSSFAFYGSEDHPVRVLVRLPGREIAFDRATVDASTGNPGGEDGVHPDHQPTFFVVTVSYPDAASTRADILAKAPAMHLDAAEAERAGVGNPAESPPESWRSYRLSENEHSTDDPTHTISYFFDVDYYRNAAVDRIKHDSVVDLDLRSPSRAALGFRPGYAQADVRPDPGRALTVTLRSGSGSGRFTLGTDTEISSGTSTTSTPAAADAPPAYTYISDCQQPGPLRTSLLAAAAPLGLDRQQVTELPSLRHPGAGQQNARFVGRTSTFRTTVDYGYGNDGLTACAKIRLDYR